MARSLTLPSQLSNWYLETAELSTQRSKKFRVLTANKQRKFTVYKVVVSRVEWKTPWLSQQLRIMFGFSGQQFSDS